MSIFSRIFSSGDGKPQTTSVKFGRFAEQEETDEMIELKETADDLYAGGQCREAYVTFFEYMQKFGGPAVKCSVDEYNNELNFQLIQGSKTVIGTISEDEVSAKSVVATVDGQNVALMRYLLQQNDDLAYSKFGICEGRVELLQRCPIKDMSPSAFRDMLSEISLTANSAGEFIASEFPGVSSVRETNIVELPSSEVSLKIKYLRKWIEETFDLVESTDNEKVRSVIILRVLFKILYLISPEGVLLQKVESILEIYGDYDPDADNNLEINFRMLAELEDLLTMTDRELAKSLYVTYAVFPVLAYRSFMEMTDAMRSLLKLPMQLSDMRREDLIVVGCEYIIGAQLARFGLHDLAYELLNVMYRVLNTDFFYGLGFRDVWYNDTVEQLAAEKISLEINAIIQAYSSIYGQVFDSSNLVFESLEDFAYSFLIEFCNIQIPD